ncbi:MULTISPECIES: uridine kinase [Francisella]|uniref:Uridine kinase n=1 Tax=Francisella adeliensis TaxID=2007306 RepID=A0A2Z4XYR9_9GAMM|nr:MULTISPECIES: uridine kinase [Francisella]AXA34021.1 uridine kinase [Francisella adeliensis]MBK2085181.1 uridine kinase [Francisella adeliensis]MBK2096051.1 uridine kinase [Francisella adeliensis]QIW12258.1 uridine kinase [Francisella adeliensis]QIW14133.1 uridine kinase [Francisella adeliensis]
MARDVFIIGIVGGSGSGKTLFSNAIIKKLHSRHLKRIAVISEDRYYKNWGALVGYEEACNINYDHPDAFDHKLLKKDLAKLISGQDIEVPFYDYSTHSRIEEKAETISAGVSVIILEGIMLFNDPKLLKMMDFKVYMDTPSDLCFIRRMLRDQKERGRTVDSIVSQYLNTVRPMHIKFIEPSKRKADIIIPDGAQNKTVINVIYNKVKQLLKKNGVRNG